MNVVGLTDTVEYVPDWNDNKQLPTAEQVKVTIRVPTVSEYNEFVQLVQNEKGNLFTTNITKIARCITKVENLVVRGITIKNGEVLLEYVECTELLDEILVYVINLKKT